MDFGTFGVWTTFHHIGEENAGAAAALAEELGFGTFWLGGSPRLASVRPLLEASERIVVGTSIVNVWNYEGEAETLAAEYADLAADFGERLVVGIGIGHPEATSDYTKPLKSTREFLDAIDAAPAPIPPERRCLAALGPKMLDLSAARGIGTVPYFVGPAHTAFARERLGAGKLVAPELACFVGDDRQRGRAAAREYAAVYLGLRNYTANLLRHGFAETDLAGGGSERLLDEIIPQGSAAKIVAAAREHLDAGADHVALQPVGIEGIPRAEWAALAAAIAS
jgi:probable F420-dependent oxidoreductase